MLNNKDNRVLCLGTIGLTVAPWKFHVLKTSNICPRSFASRANICFKNIKFPRGNYRPISSSTETLYCLNSFRRRKNTRMDSGRPRKFSVNKQAYRKKKKKELKSCFCCFLFQILKPWANICFKNIKFLSGNYQLIVPQQKHSILFK